MSIPLLKFSLSEGVYTISTTVFAIKLFAIKLSTTKPYGNTKAESGEISIKTEAEFFVKTEAKSSCQKQDGMDIISKKKTAEYILYVK